MKAETDYENIAKRMKSSKQKADRNLESALPRKKDLIGAQNKRFNKSEREKNPHRNPVKTDSTEEHVNPSERKSNSQEPSTSWHRHRNTDKTVKEDPIVTDQTYEKIPITDNNKTDKHISEQMFQYHAQPPADQTLNITANEIESDEELDVILLKAMKTKTKMIQEGLIQCCIWDFAGEKDYYVTHQTFLTSNAIYIIVADVNKDIKTLDMIAQDKDFDSIGGKNLHIKELEIGLCYMFHSCKGKRQVKIKDAEIITRVHSSQLTQRVIKE